MSEVEPQTVQHLGMPDEGAFRDELQSLLNRHCRENGSNTPDFLLANYLLGCLKLYDQTTKDRDRWYGVELKPAGSKFVIEQDFRGDDPEAIAQHFKETILDNVPKPR